MEDVDGGLHPAVDGQSLDEDEIKQTTVTMIDASVVKMRSVAWFIRQLSLCNVLLCISVFKQHTHTNTQTCTQTHTHTHTHTHTQTDRNRHTDRNRDIEKG